MAFAWTAVFYISVVVGVFLLAVFMGMVLPAITTKMMTGEWPHESDEAKSVYDSINR